jgi:hypothetical protein
MSDIRLDRQYGFTDHKLTQPLNDGMKAQVIGNCNTSKAGSGDRPTVIKQWLLDQHSTNKSGSNQLSQRIEMQTGRVGDNDVIRAMPIQGRYQTRVNGMEINLASAKDSCNAPEFG